LRTLWLAVDRGEAFDIGEIAQAELERTYAFVSGSSVHEQRIATIQDIYRRFGVMIDTHTADGVKVGLEHRERDVPLICLETAQPVKFAGVIAEALGREPDCPAHCRGLEQLPQRVTVMAADAAVIMDFIAQRCEK